MAPEDSEVKMLPYWSAVSVCMCVVSSVWSAMCVVGCRVRRLMRSLTLTCLSWRTTSTSASGVIYVRSLTSSSESSNLLEIFSSAMYERLTT